MRNRITLGVALSTMLVAAGVTGFAFVTPDARVEVTVTDPYQARTASDNRAASASERSFEERIRQEPDVLIERGMERAAALSGYRCTFIKQERIDGKLKPAETIDVKFKSDPKTVYMTWLENPGKVKRALFIDQPQYVNDEGQKLAKVEPAGAVARLFVSETMVPINDERAQRMSRRTIDDFGFAMGWELLERYNRIAAQEGHYDMTFKGEGEIDGRPTYVLVRKLPYTGLDGKYPDALLIMHVDQEWLLPTAIFSYADQAGETLLGSYVYKDVELNPAFEAEDFKF